MLLNPHPLHSENVWGLKQAEELCIRSLIYDLYNQILVMVCHLMNITDDVVCILSETLRLLQTMLNPTCSYIGDRLSLSLLGKSGCQKSTISIILNVVPLCHTSCSIESSIIINLPSCQVLKTKKNTL